MSKKMDVKKPDRLRLDGQRERKAVERESYAARRVTLGPGGSGIIFNVPETQKRDYFKPLDLHANLTIPILEDVDLVWHHYRLRP